MFGGYLWYLGSLAPNAPLSSPPVVFQLDLYYPVPLGFLPALVPERRPFRR